MATEKKEKGAELSEEIKNLSALISKGIEIDRETGTAPENKDLFSANLPEGISIDTVKAINNYQRNFIVAGRHAVGMKAVEVLASNKKLEEVNVVIPLEGRDRVEYITKRSEPYKYSITGEEGVHYGNTSVKVSMRACSNNSQLKLAQQIVREAGLAKLSK